ncbi:MAG TPA: DUF998 domain-containing protein [Chthoniobacterales bacterium]|jgi:hypothetical membrane protein|nr:DUF998 domain-containing protein [Chthoniobacterales bacterium]
MNRTIGLLAMFNPLLFTGVYLTMSAMRPEYSHLTKAISELGSVDAPRAWAWSVFGYIIPGLVVALLGLGVRKRFGPERGALLPGAALVLSGLLIALSGLFPGDFDNRTSPTMIVHTIGSLGSFVAFLVAAFSLPRIMRKAREWQPMVWPSLALTGASILTGFLRSGNAPGLGQRLGFACFFLWVALIGYALYRDPSPGARQTP